MARLRQIDFIIPYIHHYINTSIYSIYLAYLSNSKKGNLLKYRHQTIIFPRLLIFHFKLLYIEGTRLIERGGEHGGYNSFQNEAPIGDRKSG